MLRTKNFGRKSLNEIKAILATMGLSLGMRIDGWPPKDFYDEKPEGQVHSISQISSDKISDSEEGGKDFVSTQESDEFPKEEGGDDFVDLEEEKDGSAADMAGLSEEESGDDEDSGNR